MNCIITYVDETGPYLKERKKRVEHYAANHDTATLVPLHLRGRKIIAAFAPLALHLVACRAHLGTQPATVT